MTKKFVKAVTLLCAFVIAFSSLSVLHIFADQSGIFTYKVSGSGAVLTGVASTAKDSITIPDTLGGYSVIAINGAFAYKSKITEVIMPNSVKSIGADSFSCCSKLKRVQFSENLTSIGKAAFFGCSMLEAVEMPDTVKTLGQYSFSWCDKLSSLKLSNSLDTIDKGAFSGCVSLYDINIPDSVEIIMQGAFEQTKYYNTNENWENGVLYIGNHLIATKKNISGLYEVKPGTKSLAERCFSMCSSLTGIIIYKDLKIIAEAAFYGCEGITDVYYEGTVDNRRKLDVRKNNNYFNNALWHYMYDPNVKEYAPGDINGDEVVNNKDALRFLKYLTNWDVEVMPDVLDVNGDKEINNKDLIRLLKYLSGWNVKIYSKNVGAEFSGEDHGPVVPV